MTMLTNCTGWEIIEALYEYDFESFWSFIHVYRVYHCGHEDFLSSCTFAEFKSLYMKTDGMTCYIYTDDIDDNEIDYVDIKIWDDDVCCECEHEDTGRIYCDECIHPTGFEKVTKYHGIAAYNMVGLHTVSDYLERLKSINTNPEWQICCSSRPIGLIGAVIDGDVLCASNMDLYTYIDQDNGRRYFDGSRYRAKHLVNDASELDSSIWSHDEIVTQHNHVRYIWVYDKADEKTKNYGKFIARLLKVAYVEVSNALINE